MEFVCLYQRAVEKLPVALCECLRTMPGSSADAGRNGSPELPPFEWVILGIIVISFLRPFVHGDVDLFLAQGELDGEEFEEPLLPQNVDGVIRHIV